MKKSLKVALMAVACACGITTLFAFSKGDLEKSGTTLTYTYNLSTVEGARDVSNWTYVPGGSAPSCGTPGDIPCKISFDSSVYATLQDYINDQHFASDDDVAYGPGVSRKQ